MSRKKLYIILGCIIGVVLIYAVVRANSGVPGQYDAFAQCITEKGAKMYGAYWCPHCQNQKKQFGKSFSKVTYIECAQPGNPNAQVKECVDAKISGYPTWEFADGSRMEGEMSLEALAEKTGCQLENTSSK